MHLSPEVRLLADYLQPLGYACAYTGKWHLGTGSDRRSFRDFVTRASDYDVDESEQNDILRFTERIGVTIGGKQGGHDADPARFDRRTKIGPSLLPLAYHPSMLDARAAARFIHGMATDERPFCLVYFLPRAASAVCQPAPVRPDVRPGRHAAA